MTTRVRRGFTLPELLIAMLVAFALIGAGYFMLNMATDVYRKVSGHQDGALQMKKIVRMLQTDLQASAKDEGAILGTNVTTVAGPLGNTGDALWMLSASLGDDALGSTVAVEDGGAYWQRNILYYPAIPNGDPCPGVVDADGYEVGCPSKVVLRKVIDNPPATTVDLSTLPVTPSIANRESLLTNVTAYLTRPTGFTTVGMGGEPGLTSAHVVAVNILSMRVEKNPDPAAPGEIKVTLKAFNEEAGRRNTNVGTTDLSNHAKTLTHVVSVFPRNPAPPADSP